MGSLRFMLYIRINHRTSWTGYNFCTNNNDDIFVYYIIFIHCTTDLAQVHNWLKLVLHAYSAAYNKMLYMILKFHLLSNTNLPAQKSMSTAYKLTETFWLKHPAIKHIIHQQFLNKWNSAAVYINATMSVYCTKVYTRTSNSLVHSSPVYSGAHAHSHWGSMSVPLFSQILSHRCSKRNWWSKRDWVTCFPDNT